MKTTDLTRGDVSRKLILFSLPMIAGNLIQQCYNIADTLVVGRVIGPGALAAVGSAYTQMTLLNSIIIGLCMGGSVVLSGLFGAGRIREFRTALFNSFWFTFAVALLVNVLAAVFLRPLLRLLNIEGAVLQDSLVYLSVILAGMVFTFLYNFYSNALRSIGNTMVPLVFLGAAAIMNIVLDVVFTMPLHMGIAGAAWATVLSQAASAVGLMFYFYRKAGNFLPRRENRTISKNHLRSIVLNSLLTGIQQSVMNTGILMIQGLVNSFGVTVMAAFAAAVKIDAFAYMPAQDFGNAFAVYVAQNRGAEREDRIREGLRSAVKISGLFCMAASGLVALFAEPLMTLFVGSAQTKIVQVGVSYLRSEGLCYVGIGLLFLLYAYFRGMDATHMSIVLTVISLGLRVVLSYALAPAYGYQMIWWSIPIGWLIADGVGFLCVRRKNRVF